MSVTVTQRDLITRACYTLGVTQPGEVVPDATLTAASDILTELIDSWNVQALTVLNVARTVYDLTSGKGGPDDPYTLGPGGDWDTGTAARPPEILNASLKLNSSNTPIEIPLALVTDDQYAAQSIKTQTNPLPQWLYYNPTSPLGSVYLWNVPTNDTNQIVLYTDALTPQFDGLDTAYVCPPSYVMALRLCLADALTDILNVPSEILQRVHLKAGEALANLKASNVKMADLSLDPALTPTPHGTYIIQTDQGG